MLMPIGPGVDSDTASIFIRSVWLYHPVERPMFFRKGNVAMPPPTANRPVLKNSQKSRR